MVWPDARRPVARVLLGRGDRFCLQIADNNVAPLRRRRTVLSLSRARRIFSAAGVIANLELMPDCPNDGKSDGVGDRQRALAKRLFEAGLLSRKGLKAVEKGR
jgi:hypothetical protein